MLLAPRTHGKSTIANLAATVWFLLHDPDIRILITSNTSSQAVGFIEHLKRVLEHKDFRAIFGDVRGDIWRTQEISVKGGRKVHKEGNVTALGMGCSLPSRHFDVIILDDIIDEDDVQTEGQREKSRNWYFGTLEPTLTKGGTMIVIGTRWHYYDLYGELLSSGGYHLMKYKAVLEWSTREDLWQQYVELKLSPEPEDQKAADRFLEEHREEMYAGTRVLLPEVWPYEALMLKRARSGSLIFAKQYQNEPQLGEGDQIFKVHDLRYYAPEDMPDRGEFLAVVSAYDLAISQKERADFFAGVTIGATKNAFYVLDRVRGKFTFEQQYQTIFNQHTKWREDRVRIETVQYQQALAQVMRNRTTIPIDEYRPAKDKVTRAITVQPQVENHRVLFNQEHRDLIRELTEFPYSDHDDLVDAFTMALGLAVELREQRLRKRNKKPFFYI